MKWHLFYLSSLICILTLVSSACAAIPTAGREQTNLPLSLENIKNSQAGPQQVESNGAMDQQRGSLPPTAGVSANNQTAGSNVTTGSLPPAADMQVEGQVPASNPSG